MPIPGVGEVEDQFLVGSWFAIDMPKVKIAGISEVSGLAVEVDVVEVAQAGRDGKLIVKKRPAAAKYGDITLKRKMTDDKSMYNWVDSIRNGGKDYRTNGSIILYNIANEEVGRWNFVNAWPTKWSCSDIDVGTDDPLTEEVTLCIEQLVREK